MSPQPEAENAEDDYYVFYCPKTRKDYFLLVSDILTLAFMLKLWFALQSDLSMDTTLTVKIGLVYLIFGRRYPPRGHPSVLLRDLQIGIFIAAICTKIYAYVVELFYK